MTLDLLLSCGSRRGNEPYRIEFNPNATGMKTRHRIAL